MIIIKNIKKINQINNLKLLKFFSLKFKGIKIQIKLNNKLEKFT